jgi:hypothetical protein
VYIWSTQVRAFLSADRYLELLKGHSVAVA